MMTKSQSRVAIQQDQRATSSCGKGGWRITGEFHKINTDRQSVRPVKAWKKSVMSIQKTNKKTRQLTLGRTKDFMKKIHNRM